MDEAPVIFEYLPRESRSPDEAKYLDFLWDSFHSNYQSEKYQFAFLAFHMLYMSFVYEVVWKIRAFRFNDFEKSLTTYVNDKANKFLSASSPRAFGAEKEKAIFRFLKLLGATNEEIGAWAKVVDDRNLAAHPNGVISFTDAESLDNQISKTIDYVNDIHTKTYPILNRLLTDFLQSSWNVDENAYATLEEEISQNFIAKNHLSVADVMHLHNYDIEQLSTDEHYAEIGDLFNTFIKLTESWGE